MKIPAGLYNPFEKIGWIQLLLFGLIIIILTSALCTISDTRLDGVIDVEMGWERPIWVYLLDGLVNLLSAITGLLIVATLVSKSKFRILDLVGAQAFARMPFIFTPIIGVFYRNNNTIDGLLSLIFNPGEMHQLNLFQVVYFVLITIAFLITIIWSVTMMYHGYKWACKPVEKHAGWSFGLGLLISEILSKVIYWQMFVHQVI